MSNERKRGRCVLGGNWKKLELFSVRAVRWLLSIPLFLATLAGPSCPFFSLLHAGAMQHSGVGPSEEGASCMYLPRLVVWCL